VRIAYAVTRADSVGGASIHVRDLARAMLERGHEVLVLVGGLGPVTAQLKAAGVPFRALEFCRRAIDPVTDFRGILELTRVLGEWRPDLVSAHTAKAGWLARAAAARLGIPAVYTPHGWSIGGRISHAAGAVFAAAEKIAARWTAAIVCVSESERDLALRKRVAPPDLLRVVHNGVADIDPELRAEPGRTPVRICSVARFEAPKDHATLLRALALVRSAEWQLDLVGDGPLEAATRRLAADLGLETRVHFLGYMADPAEALAASQIFVLSSRSEGFPRSILEAMRAGLPVVASNAGGIPEAVADGSTGWIVPPGSPDALAAALGSLILDGGERARLGAAGRASYEDGFRLATMVELTASIYIEVLKRTIGGREYRSA
jgi:glycosyltransferase involved in cell wall biosynthesis